jgi:hypothetical protein
VLAPETPPDERSFLAYAIVRKDDTNYSYVTPWKKLPTGVLFNLSNSIAVMTNYSLPYPIASGALTTLPVISFVSDGALEDYLHPEGKKPILPLQVGVRMTTTELPAYQGSYITNQIVVERLSGKVKVQRTEAK